MNTKRRAELQRKLSLAPVPKPPAGLAERIKNDIPEYLRPEAERGRFSRSVSFNLRIAASVLIVIASVIGAVYLMTPEEQLMRMASTHKEAPVTAKLEDTAAAATDQVEVEITQSMPAERPAVIQVADATAAQPSGDFERAVRREQAPAASTAALGETTAAPPPALMADAGSLPAAEPAPVPPPAAPAPPPMSTVTAPEERVTVTAEAPRVAEQRAAAMSVPSLVPEALAAPPQQAARRDSVFGISVDPEVFHRIRETLEKNQRPKATAVNIEAIINYFAGAPAAAPRKGVRLELEGSPSPVAGDAHRGFLRFTVDTAEANTQLPLGANATLTIDLNARVVDRAQPVGDSTTIAPEAALLHNVSVTGLYELTLKPNIRSSDRVATVHLTYTRTTDGKVINLDKTVYARDFTRTWTRASRRHRLASLGAVWGESLKVASPAPEVARRAAELATQEPGDERAQELKTAATASSKLTNGF